MKRVVHVCMCVWPSLRLPHTVAMELLLRGKEGASERACCMHLSVQRESQER